LGDGVTTREVDDEPEIVVLVQAGLANLEGGRDVSGGPLGLMLGVLGCRRGNSSRVGQVEDGGGVAQRPHAGVSRYRQVLIDDEPALVQREVMTLRDRADQLAVAGPRRPRPRYGWEQCCCCRTR